MKTKKIKQIQSKTSTLIQSIKFVLASVAGPVLQIPPSLCYRYIPLYTYDSTHPHPPSPVAQRPDPPPPAHLAGGAAGLPDEQHGVLHDVLHRHAPRDDAVGHEVLQHVGRRPERLAKDGGRGVISKY